MDAAKKKSLSPAGLTALRVLLLLVVALFLPETRVWGFDASPHPASGQIAFASASTVEEIAPGIAYDASGSLVAAETTAAGGSQTTVIGRMEHLEQFADNPAVDTWAKSGRIPAPGEPPVTWAENKAWLDERIARGDQFGIATDSSYIASCEKWLHPRST